VSGSGGGRRDGDGDRRAGRHDRRPEHRDVDREESPTAGDDEREGPAREWELPPHLRDQQRRAVRLEWITIAYMLSAIVLLALTLGQSQAMKAAWIEDLLSLLPPTAFLIASRLRNRSPSSKFPWGKHRAVSIAYLFAALALLVMGGYLLFDSAVKLILAEHPPIGVISLFGNEVWLGWVMIVALLYSGVPAVFLGRAKLKLADDLHDKVLYADAQMNKADWMTVTAAIVGIIGIGFGLWWADAAAAIFISVDIIHDGFSNVRAAVHDLMDARPRRHDAREYHPVVEQMNQVVNGCDWVERGAVRLREEGHVFTGEVMVVPRTDEDLVDRLEELANRLLELEWKVYDIVVVPVKEIDIASPEGSPGVGGSREAEESRA
jgi:cation diffusion facilitator family transporter